MKIKGMMKMSRDQSLRWIVGGFVCASILIAPTVIVAADLRAGFGSGEWYSFSGESMRGRWEATLQASGDSGEELAGSITIRGSNAVNSGSLKGKISGSSISFGVVQDGAKRMTFDGVIDGQVVKGQWSLDGTGEEGAWLGTLAR